MRVAFTKRTELFAPLGEDAADALAGGGTESEGVGFAIQAQENGIHFRRRVEALCGDKVLPLKLESRLQKNGNRPEGLAAVRRGVAVAGFFLQHEYHALRQLAGEHGIHPRCGDGVGEVGDDFIAAGGALCREPGERVVKAITFDQMELRMPG